MLGNTLGIPNSKGEYTYVGPGEADVPDAYAEALGLTLVQEPAKDYSSLNTEDFLDLVVSGELTRADALALEQSREKPRAGVLKALGEQEG